MEELDPQISICGFQMDEFDPKILGISCFCKKKLID